MASVYRKKITNMAESRNCRHTKDTLRCAEYVQNYDGDTITFNVPYLHPLIGKHISIRVNGIDTPEIRGKTDCEKRKAQEAKEHVAQMLKKASNIELHNIQRGKYFRIVADIFADGQSVKDSLILSGLSVYYDGGKKQKVDWCLPVQNFETQFSPNK